MNDETPKEMEAAYLLDLAHQLHHRVVNGGTQGQYLGELNAEILSRIEAAQAVAPGGGDMQLRARIAGELIAARDTEDGCNRIMALLAAAPASEPVGDARCSPAQEVAAFEEWARLRFNRNPETFLRIEGRPANVLGLTWEYNGDGLQSAWAAWTERARTSKPAASSAAGECNRNCDCVGECKAGNDSKPVDAFAERLRADILADTTINAEQEQAWELPEPQAEVSVAGYNDGLLRPALEDYFTADQMHAFYRKGYDAALLRRAARVEVTDAMVDRVAEVLIPPGATRIRICEAYNLARRVIAAALEPEK